MTKERIQIDVISDIVCPWCYIAKRRLDAALKLRPDIKTFVSWRSFYLNSWIDRVGITRNEYLDRKFGPGSHYHTMYDRIARLGAQENINFRFDLIRVQPHTGDAHRLIYWASKEGLEKVALERLFHGFFTKGEDIGDARLLSDIANEIDMDGDKVYQRLNTKEDMDIVEKNILAWQTMGIDSVPHFIFDNDIHISGAQPVSTLTLALDEAAAKAEK